MKCISAVTIGKLIEAHMDHDFVQKGFYCLFLSDREG